MGLRDRVVQWLDRGSMNLDQAEFVEFAVVHVGAGPLRVTRLQEAGIDAHDHDAFNVATQVLSDDSVTVRRRDLAVAAQVDADG